jgi:hypothetical protein
VYKLRCDPVGRVARSDQRSSDPVATIGPDIGKYTYRRVRFDKRMAELRFVPTVWMSGPRP